MGLAMAALPPDGGWMGKRETAEEVDRRLGREGFGLLTEAGFTGPHDIDGGFGYAGHGLRITICHYHWKSEAEVVATVCALGVPVQGSTPASLSSRPSAAPESSTNYPVAPEAPD
ncbi:hypothetical protein ACFWX5_30845 [[Kitasatospora] papulosa]|uniref:hypothetical protein n=1 Tax=[Kitasatospora] papulosa TaxID=1464011 RepID=UPI0036A4A952